MTKSAKSKSPAKMSMAEAIAARKAARTPVVPATLPPQTVIDRKGALTRDVTRLEGFACDLKVLCDLAGRLKRPDLDGLARAMDKLEEAIKATRKGMS